MYLRYADPYTKATSKSTSLDALAPPDSDVGILEGLRNLNNLRNQAILRECFTLGSENIETHVKAFESYLSLLQQFLTKAHIEEWSVDLTMQSRGKDAFLWSSPVSVLSSKSHFSLPTVYLEQAMAMCFYAAALQENAYQVLQSATAAAQEESAAVPGGNNTAALESAHMTAITLLRTAAGVYALLKEKILPFVDEQVPDDKAPLEVQPSVADILETISLAQAQSVAASRAELKGVSAGAVCAVYRGAVELYESAAAKVKSFSIEHSSGRTPLAALSERLRMWLALSAELHAAKAFRAQAGVCRAEKELGTACACLKDGLIRAQRCLAVAVKEPEWQQPIKEEIKKIEAALQVYDKERNIVYMQVIPTALPQPLDGKIIVTAAVYALSTASEHYFI